MIETKGQVCSGMVGHTAHRFVGATFPGQHLAMSYPHPALAAAMQTPSQHILQSGLTPYAYQQDIYGLLAKQQQNSPIMDQTHSPQTAQSHDHPIGYGAFGVVW